MNRLELVRTLELVKPALDTKSQIPIFQCFTFSPGTVAAYNDTVAIIGPCDIENSFGLHGSTLLGILSATSAEEINVTKAANEVTITAGKFVSKMPFDTEDSFIFTEPTGSAKWPKIPITQSLVEAMELCLETVSNDETQLALHGITIENNHFYSCNGDTITRVKIKDGGKERILMPTPFCEAVVRLWSSLDMVKGTLQFNDEWIFADFTEWSVYGRILEIKEPIDFEALIKKTIKTKPKMMEIPDALSEALSRAQVLADPESQRTVLSISDGKIKLLTETHMGTVRDEISIPKGREGGLLECKLSAAHVQRSLSRSSHIAFMDSCTLLEKGSEVFILISNMG